MNVDVTLHPCNQVSLNEAAFSICLVSSALFLWQSILKYTGTIPPPSKQARSHYVPISSCLRCCSKHYHTKMLMLWLWLSLCVLGAGNTYTHTRDLIPFQSLLWNKSKTSYAAVSESHLCYLTTISISTIDRSQAGNCRPEPNSKLESVGEEDDLFGSLIIISPLKTLWLMLTPLIAFWLCC